MSRPPKTTELIRERIEKMPLGELFTPGDFIGCGTRLSATKALSRLAKAGTIDRGVFTRPEFSRYVGKVTPDSVAVTKTIAKSYGAVVQTHGAEAVRRLGLATQMQVKPVFVTSGPSRRIHVGKLEIRLQHVCPPQLTLGDRPAGLALTAIGESGWLERALSC